MAEISRHQQEYERERRERAEKLERRREEFLKGFEKAFRKQKVRITYAEADDLDPVTEARRYREASHEGLESDLARLVGGDNVEVQVVPRRRGR